MNSDGLRAQAQIYQHIAMRDLPKRYVCVHFLLYGTWISGFELASAIIWLAITGLELIASYVIRQTPKATQISETRLFWYLSTSSIISCLYFAPSVILAQQPDFGLYMLGLIWVFAATAGASIMYHALPAFFWSVIIPGCIAALIVLLAGFKLGFSEVTVQSWSIAVGLLLLHLVNTVRTMWDFRDTNDVLNNTRAESLERLRQLERLSSHDTLTGLLNRAAFDSRLAKCLRSVKPGQNVGVILMDLNGFKPINDTYGHGAGDAVLIAVARRLAKFGDGLSAPARLGGDEFAMIVPPHMEESAAVAFAAAMIADLRDPIIHKTVELRISASAGIAFSGEEFHRAAELYSAADQAMYRAKANSGERPVLYRPDLFPPRPSLQDKNRLEIALRNGEIGPFYQLKIGVDSGEIRGLEALVRWRKPGGKILAPGAFLDDAQSLGLMPELTYWMLRRVLEDLSGWLADGLEPGRVAVNIPEITLATQNGREDLDWLLSEFEHCRAHITFEITEDVVIARSGDIIKASIDHFAASGVAISLDDFGTGFASFQHLQHLTFGEMKIDTSFVAGLGSDPVADVIIEGFILIARGLGVDITAEGVETEEQLEHLRKLGCTYAQGYLFSPAVPAAEVRAQMIGWGQTARSA